jgi:cyclic pyranopterin phosphate synthase
MRAFRILRSSGLSHVDAATKLPTMVDVSGKPSTVRTAVARSVVRLPAHVAALFLGEGEGAVELNSKKGPVISTAIIAGTMAVKRTSDLIPFCHPLPLDSIKFATGMDAAQGELTIDCTVKVVHKTGVEMEALTGASVAALTVYDMCKALSHDIVIAETRLLDKTGGKSNK